MRDYLSRVLDTVRPPVAVTSRGRHSSRDAWSLASCPSRGCSRRTRRRSRTLLEVGEPPDGESPVAPGGGKDSSTSTVGGRCGSGSSSSIRDAWPASSARCRALIGLPRAAGESGTAARRSASPSTPVVARKRLCIGIQAPIHARRSSFREPAPSSTTQPRPATTPIRPPKLVGKPHWLLPKHGLHRRMERRRAGQARQVRRCPPL